MEAQRIDQLLTEEILNSLNALLKEIPTFQQFGDASKENYSSFICDVIIAKWLDKIEGEYQHLKDNECDLEIIFGKAVEEVTKSFPDFECQ